MCAVTVTTVLAGVTTFIADVEATADADVTTGNIAHGLGAVPQLLTLCPLLQAEAALSQWAITTADATNLVATAANAVGSGGAGNQVRLIASLPHSLIS